MLKDILDTKKCFKLVCGAGNEDLLEVEKLVALYSKAGCNFFDLSANKSVFEAARRGLDFSIPKDEQHNFHFCISVGLKGDPHVQKALIDEQKCIFCRKCIDVCPRGAIFHNGDVCKVSDSRCIGCSKCAKVCPYACISFYSEDKDLTEVLPTLVEQGIDCIEFHAIGDDEDEVDKKWAEIQDCYDGVLSICVDRSKLGNERLLARIKKMIDTRNPYSTIIQADGAPMSGGEDDYKTTLQAVATAAIVQDADLPVYILLSGGTNSKSVALAKQCGVNPNGVTIGSYARYIVRDYLQRDDFLTNKVVFEEALHLARQLVAVSFESLQK